MRILRIRIPNTVRKCVHSLCYSIDRTLKIYFFTACLNDIFVIFVLVECDRSEIIDVEEVQKYATRDLHRVQAHVPQKFIRET